MKHRAPRSRRGPRALAVGIFALTPLVLVASAERASHPPAAPLAAASVASSPIPEIGYVLGEAASAAPPSANNPRTAARVAVRPLTSPTSPSVSGVATQPASESTPDRPATDVTAPSAASVRAGVLVISTAYTAAAPFSLGELRLDPQGTGLIGSACFGCAGEGITITDTREQDRGWTVSAQTSDFATASGHSVIDGDSLVFDDIVATDLDGSPTADSVVRTQAIDHFKATRKSFATTRSGSGTVALRGEFALVAPTSARPGAYTATITFTVV